MADMSIIALKWAFRVPVEGAVKGVLLALADHADDADGFCFPKIERIQQWAGYRRRAVHDALKKLKAWGLITVQGTDRYVVNVGSTLDPSASDAAKPARDAKGGVRQTPSAMQPTHSPVRQTHATIKMNPQLTPKEKSPVPPSSPAPLDLLPDAPKRDIGWEAVEVWHQICGDSLGKPTSLNGTRRSRMEKVLKSEFGNDLANWEAYCRTIRANPFNCGSAPSGWIADLDWALKEKTLRKVVEASRKPPNVVPLRPRTASENKWSHFEDEPDATAAEPSWNTIDGEVLERSWGP